MKNWKSTMAFLVFVGVYVFSVYTTAGVDVLDVTGNIALISSLFMMLRSQVTSDIFGRLVDNIKIGRG